MSQTPVALAWVAAVVPLTLRATVSRGIEVVLMLVTDICSPSTTMVTGVAGKPATDHTYIDVFVADTDDEATVVGGTPPSRVDCDPTGWDASSR